jgi:long-chain acyl-CoA synthetase
VDGFPSDLKVERIVSVDITEAMPWGTRFALRLPVAKARAARAQLTATPKARKVLTWQKLVDGRRLTRRHPRPVLDDIALLQYTSGTTGTPKGAILTHRNLRANAMQGRAWVPGLHEGEETFYGVLPLFHAYGMTLCLTFAMSIGAKLVLFPKYDAKLVADAAKKSPPTFLPAVPPIYDQLARSAERGDVDLKSVRFAISGAMSLPVETVTRWEEATGGLLVEGYGMTETSPVALGNPIGPSRRPGTVGVPFPSTEIRVVDPADTSVDRPFGEAGELLIRGPQVFQGYWRRPTETAESLLPGGWVRTGDIVTVSPDGFVTVVDRLKEIIITGGFNVAPTEVEEALHAHPDVIEAAVVALPRKGGEEVVAAIVLREGAELDPEALRDYCKLHLAAYKVPRRFFAVDELPRSLIGKVLRRQVREQLLRDL